MNQKDRYERVRKERIGGMFYHRMADRKGKEDSSPAGLRRWQQHVLKNTQTPKRRPGRSCFQGTRWGWCGISSWHFMCSRTNVWPCLTRWIRKEEPNPPSLIQFIDSAGSVIHFPQPAFITQSSATFLSSSSFSYFLYDLWLCFFPPSSSPTCLYRLLSLHIIFKEQNQHLNSYARCSSCIWRWETFCKDLILRFYHYKVLKR